ncbi:aminotransferase class V-fold PLP-dependent enzyme [Actinomyces vulturis]|uniref:aminotransferase class V-fold PLP-dependent enzyme n=1 Tax=Actinomyces vulturis TaxID=1857645 RepID=UPI0008319AD8|nr:aminotransferase class V-fold PLP-dependent enzyme [Actinomyces vulturis]
MTSHPFTPVPSVDDIRADFPILAKPVRGQRPLVYLDSGATSQKPQQVIDAVSNFYAAQNGAAGRSTYELADESTRVVDEGRINVAEFVGAQDTNVVFTKNATEAINLVSLAIEHAGAIAQHPLAIGEGDEVVVTRAEHHANLVPWQQLCQRSGATLKWIDLDEQGRLDMATLNVITPATRVVALTHASNVTGAITELGPVLDAVNAIAGSKAPSVERGGKAIVVLDTCQSSVHIPINFALLSKAGVDALCLSAHKMLGPTGVGALVATEELLDLMPPVLTGGSMIELVSMDSSTFMTGPSRFEAGTMPMAQIAGWSAALNYIKRCDMSVLREREDRLTLALLRGMRDMNGIRILGPADDESVTSGMRLGVVAFDVGDVHPHDVGQVLDSYGVAVRTGHHCAQPLHAHFGVRSSARASLGPYSNATDVDRFLEALPQVRHYFGRS